MKILPTVLGFRRPIKPLSEAMMSKLPSVPTTEAKLMTLTYGIARAGVLYNSDVALPFSDNPNSIASRNDATSNNDIMPVYSDVTQLNSTSSWVELCRYKRAVRQKAQVSQTSCVMLHTYLSCLTKNFVHDYTHTSHSATTVSLGSALVSEPAISLPSGLDASALGQFSMKLHELKAVHALQSLSQVLKT